MIKLHPTLVERRVQKRSEFGIRGDLTVSIAVEPEVQMGQLYIVQSTVSIGVAGFQLLPRDEFAILIE